MIKLTIAALVLMSDVQDPPKMADNSTQIKKLDWMIGDWIGKGEMKGMGKYTEEIRFHWTLNKNFIKADQKVWVEGKVVYTSTGMIGWDPKKKVYSWFQFGLDGAIGWSESEKTEEEMTLSSKGNVGGPSITAEFRHLYKRLKGDKLHVKNEIKKEGKWVAFAEVTFNKKKSEKR